VSVSVRTISFFSFFVFSEQLAMHRSGMVDIVEGVVKMGGDAVKVGESSYGGGMGVFALRNLRQLLFILSFCKALVSNI